MLAWCGSMGQPHRSSYKNWCTTKPDGLIYQLHFSPSRLVADWKLPVDFSDRQNHRTSGMALVPMVRINIGL